MGSRWTTEWNGSVVAKEKGMSLIEQHEVIDNGSARYETRSASSRLVLSPGQVIAAALGLATAVIGIITLARAGIDSTLNVPMVQAAGLHQSAMVGLGELIVGLLLILGASSYASRGLVVGLGVVMVLAGVLIGAAGPTILRDLGTVHRTGWVIMVGGVIAIVAGCMGRVVRTRRTVESV
jgi:hypothetical protein